MFARIWHVFARYLICLSHFAKCLPDIWNMFSRMFALALCSSVAASSWTFRTSRRARAGTVVPRVTRRRVAVCPTLPWTCPRSCWHGDRPSYLPTRPPNSPCVSHNSTAASPGRRVSWKWSVFTFPITTGCSKLCFLVMWRILLVVS